MKRIILLSFLLLAVGYVNTSCKKNRPSEKIAGTYKGNFQGNYNGNDTIVNTGYGVTISATGKNKIDVEGSLFSTFEVLVTSNGLNVEWVSPTEGLTQFLYEGETKTLTFHYEKGGNVANYVGTKN